MQKIVIIGGGIVGSSAAYLLSKENVQVTLIDSNEPGQATRAAAGIICPWLSKRRNKYWYELARNSAAFYKEIAERLSKETGRDSGYKQVGVLALRETEEKVTELFNLAIERRTEANVMGNIEKLSEDETKQKFPLVKPGFGSVYVSGAARVNGGLFCETLLYAAKENGVEIKVGRAHFSSKGEVLVDGKKESYDKLIIAAGAWLPNLLKEAGFHTDVLAQKGQLLELDFSEYETAGWPVILPPSAKSIVPFENGKIIVGATHEKAAGFNTEPTAEGRTEVLSEVTRFMEGDLESKVTNVAVGTRPYTSDFAPLIGQLPGFESIFLANGLGASGLTTGPYVGKLLVDLALLNTTDLALENYDPRKYISK
ncbi:NAD(P)/FAD-dependent oxidoreductase [Listeria farberi]|uniref:FAD-binding oxidoreductase n=1 Tax=Listeria farberi TaxID=2713500 RepID=A0A7X0ZIB6_9LIST|nr:FAD-dependent oxidoreductase [Listeria farberi]MBC1375471.1 FAD-binding oxidoreductase [Listeria farberi]MBC1381540.1 FAD-binding oxidoreductase [Listeria farberi]MBC2287487.1 FAD-binding oxidoreductase [Listeria farberi]